ncbi:MAG TPA: hypothetical protein VGA65_04160 [Hyphomicrobium sp.]|jgi:hypothetical protein
MNRQILQHTHSTATARALVPRKWVQRFALVTLAVLVTSGAVAPSVADPGRNLAGSWSGGGWVAFSTGNKEKARCRATYSRAGKDSYRLHATCATSSGKASQTATVYHVSGSRYRGSFYNSDYNVRGTIRVVVSGGSQKISLAGDGASASLSLRRR